MGQQQAAECQQVGQPVTPLACGHRLPQAVDLSIWTHLHRAHQHSLYIYTYLYALYMYIHTGAL